MKRNPWTVAAVALIAAAILFYFYPLFHIQPRGSAAEATAEQSAQTPEANAISPAAFVEEFWKSPLRGGEDAVLVPELWKAFDADATQAKAKYGRQAGLGGAWYFLVRGEGSVESVEKSRCTLEIAKTTRKVEIALGVIVGNTVREAIAVDVNQFANSQDFNALSSELNRRVEEEVIGETRQLMQVGSKVNFVGCTKVESDSDMDTLRLIPIELVVAADAPSSRESNSKGESNAGSYE